MTSSKKSETPEEQTAKKIFNIGCGGTILLIALIWIFSGIQSSLETPEQKAQKEKEKVNKWYSSTSQYSCESNLKDKLREPESYVRDGDFTTPSDNGDKKIITWKFRAKNGFGGYNAGIGMCYVGKENGGTIKTEIVN
jgi:hypothetical protein